MAVGMPSSAKKKQKAAYKSLRPILLAELDGIITAQDCDIHRAFVLETAQVLSSTASGFSLTDGKNDWGIDFCREDSTVFTIAQCKCPERAFLDIEDRSKAFDRKTVEDLLTGINFILDEENIYTAPLELKQFKNSYHQSLREWEKETRLQAALSLFGELTSQADNYFRNQRNEFEARGVDLLLWDWKKFNDLLATPTVDIQKIRLSFTINEPEKQLLRHKSPVCFVRAIDIIDAWNKYQWNLVDWNVRAEIKKSPTNKRIQDTLLSQSGRRHFQELNNGLLLVCSQVSYSDLPDKKVKMTLRQPQVVNGCQTLLSLVRAYLDLSEKDKEDFRKNVYVQMKVVANQTPEFVEKIILSTNDQNPMSPRSLKSNTLEQKQIQASFAHFFFPYFYERKDGQFEGLLNFGQKTPSFRPGDFKIAPGRKKYRTIDNEELAYEWLAFIGLSHETLRGGLRLFEKDDLYRKAFLSQPSKMFWEEMRKTPTKPPPVECDDLFESGSPMASQYMLAHTVASTIKQRKVSFRRNREEALDRLAKKNLVLLDPSGKITDDYHTVDALLLKDEQYYLGTVLNNMKDVLIELYSMILCIKYGPLDDRICESILKYPTVSRQVENPNYEMGNDTKKAESRSILNLIFEFLRFALELFIIKYGDAMRAQPRLKSYLAQRNTVDQIRYFVLEVNEEKIPGWVGDWCPGKCSFIDELPKLN